MDMSFDSQATYSNQNQSIECNPSESFINDMVEYTEDEQDASSSDLDLRMQSLLEALDHLAV